MDGSRWRDLSTIKASRKGSGARSAILEVLQEYSDGLTVMAIYKCLKERGFNITQPAVSQNLAFLESNATVWKKRRYNKEARRELWYYISTAPIHQIISKDIRKEVLITLSSSLEKNADKVPEFESPRKLLSFLEKIIQTASESIITSEELYLELSKRKPYAEIVPLLREYRKVVANVCDAIETNPNLHTYGGRRVNLRLPVFLALRRPADFAEAIIDGAIRGEKRYLDALAFLSKSTTGELRGRLDSSIEWIKQHCKFSLKNGLYIKKPMQDELAKTNPE